MEKSKLMMIFIIVLLLALLGTVVAVSLYVMSMVRNMDGGLAGLGQPTRPSPTRVLTAEEINNITIGSPLTTNLAYRDGGGRRMIRAQIMVGYDSTQGSDSAAVRSLIENEAEFIRAVLLMEISNSYYEELSASGGRAILADRILRRLQDEYNNNLIVQVVFIDWIIT